MIDPVTRPAAPQDFSLSLEALLARFGRMMRVVGARHGVGDDDLDELMQDVRVRLWQSQSNGEEIARLPTSYVYRTVLAAAVDIVRKRRRAWTRETTLDTPAAHVVASTRADGALLESQLGAAIADALATMPESRRMVVRMHLAGYSREEMSEMIGRTEGAVRNLLYRGMQDLRDQLVRAGYRWPEDG